MTEDSLGPVLRFIHDAAVFVRPPFGSPLAAVDDGDRRLPDISLAGVAGRSDAARTLLARLDAIDIPAQPHDVALTLEVLRHQLTRAAGDADRYWLVADALGIGFYGMYSWTAYNGGFLLTRIASEASAYRFRSAGDPDRYLALIADVITLVEQLTARTVGQIERGILMPAAQWERAEPLLRGLRETLRSRLEVDPARLAVDSPAFHAELGRRLDVLTGTCFDQAIATLDRAGADGASDTVGIGQYPGGAEAYRELVRLHTTMDLTPEEIHQIGVEEVERVRTEMARIRSEVGFDGDDHEYLAALGADPRWTARSVEALSAFFQKYIDRFSPVYAKYFDAAPAYPSGAGPLPKAMEPGMTFGFYDGPRAGKDRGDYLFNATNLVSSELSMVAALTYHELVPGHRLHISTQQSNDSVHPVHNTAFFNAFNEGWAEYASQLADEAGMYTEPEERFGRLRMRAFLASRLVVDTGMNALGWSLEEGRSYLREHAFLTEGEVDSESLRYACDLPGQSLAYALGDMHISRLRERTRSRLGARFDIRAFHRAVLGSGGMPLELLEWHVGAVLPS